MKEWSDEELDKLFRKSAEELEPRYEPNDWNELRRRLDDNDQVPGSGWFNKARPWTIALLLLMSLGGVSVYYESSWVGEKRDILLTASDKRAPGSSAPLNTGALPPRTTLVQPATNPKAAADNTEPEVKRIEKTTLPPRPDVSKAGGRPNEIKELPRNLASVSGVRRQTDPINRERGDGAILLAQNKSKRGARKPVKKLLNQNPEFFVGKTEGIQEDASLEEGRNPKLTDEPTDEPSEAARPEERIEVEELLHRAGIQSKEGPALPAVAIIKAADTVFVPERSIPRVPRWAIRIGISPDLSAVNMQMKNFSRPGPAASLLMEYGLSRRWAVQTGVIRSLKTYSAQAGDYEWPANWYQKQMPVSVDGTCQVFELPLNIRYDISQREKTRWFAGAGVSSYKMQNEKYVYHYKTYDPNIRWWKWEGKTGWYFLSHANASVGYERHLTERLSLMAEPYVRVPLQKVGFGKVNLFSTGVWFSVRYAPVFRK